MTEIGSLGAEDLQSLVVLSLGFQLLLRSFHIFEQAFRRGQLFVRVMCVWRVDG